MSTWGVMLKNVAGKIVLVTGSANGIGREIAINFAYLGSILVLCDTDEEGNKKTAELAKENGALVFHTYKCDLRKREEIYAVADQVKTEVGNVDILINNAGIANGQTFVDLGDADMQETLEVNTEAHFWAELKMSITMSMPGINDDFPTVSQTWKAFLPAMIAHNEGHLAAISSASAFSGSNKLTDYSASKSASFGFSESLAFEMRAAGKKGIKTTIVCPYYVNTEMVTGVKTIQPFLFPILDVGYIGKKIVDAILKEKLYLFLPSYGRFIVFKIFLPKKAVFLLAEYLRLFNNLDQFRGRIQRGRQTED